MTFLIEATNWMSMGEADDYDDDDNFEIMNTLRNPLFLGSRDPKKASEPELSYIPSALRNVYLHLVTSAIPA